MKIEQRSEIENMRGLQIYQAVAEVANAVLGGGKSNSGPVTEAHSASEMLALYKQMMGGA